MNEKHLRAFITDYARTIKLTYWETVSTIHERRIYAASNMTLNQVDEGSDYGHFVTLDKMQAQELMDDLWQCGIRPSEGSGSAGSLAATERHLHDMRALVFKNVVEPKK